MHSLSANVVDGKANILCFTLHFRIVNNMTQQSKFQWAILFILWFECKNKLSLNLLLAVLYSYCTYFKEDLRSSSQNIHAVMAQIHTPRIIYINIYISNISLRFIISLKWDKEDRKIKCRNLFSCNFGSLQFRILSVKKLVCALFSLSLSNLK